MIDAAKDFDKLFTAKLLEYLKSKNKTNHSKQSKYVVFKYRKQYQFTVTTQKLKYSFTINLVRIYK